MQLEDAVALLRAGGPGSGRHPGIVPPWKQTKAEFYKVHTLVQPPPWSSYGEGQRLSALPNNTRLWVYHATDKATAEKFAREGIDTKDKPTNLARQRYEKGEYAEYAPGRGLSGGLSIGSTPADVSGYGPAIVAVNIAKGDLAVPPEQQVLNTPTGGHALASNDAVVFGRIPPSRIVYLGSNNPKAYRQNPGPAHEEFVKYALRNDKDVPAQVRQDYPDIAEKL